MTPRALLARFRFLRSKGWEADEARTALKILSGKFLEIKKRDTI